MSATHEDPSLDQTDAKLLDLIQQGIPYVHRPFATLGERVGVSEEECLHRLRLLRDERRVIRQISAIFDTKALGYASSLVAARYDPDRLDAAAAVISEHPGVSHNYRRTHAFNLWYTLAVPPDSKLGLQGTADRLHRLSGALSTRLLPTLKLYKIGVRLTLGDDDGAPPANPGKGSFTEADRSIAAQFTLDPADRRMILVLQQNMELIPEPFVPWAQQAGCTVDQLLAACRTFEERRQMRRFSAVLRHREAGFKANVMAVWRHKTAGTMSDGEADRYGAIFAQAQEVSHCYLRPTYEDWPYSIYTMIHAPTKDDCIAVLHRLQQASGGLEFQPLWSVHEYKKVRVKYFTPETTAWETRHG